MRDKNITTPSIDSNRDLQGDFFRAVILSLMVLTDAFIVLAFFVFHELLIQALIISGGVFIVSIFLLLLIERKKVFIADILFVALLPMVFWGIMIYLQSNELLPLAVDYSKSAILGVYIFFFLIALYIQKSAFDKTKSTAEKSYIRENQYQIFLENIPTITYINDISLEARTLYVSPQVENLLGYSSNAFLQDPMLWMKIVNEDDVEEVLLKNELSVRTGEPFKVEYRLMTKGGNVIWVRDEAKLVRDDHGDPAYWLGVWTDITKEKSSEKTLAYMVQTQSMRNNQLQTASEVSRAATSILELNELMPKVVELIRSHFDYYYVGIFLVDKKTNKALLAAATGDAGKEMLVNGHSLPIGNSSMIGWSIHNNQARIALDVGKDAVRFKNPLLPLTRSEVSFPLRFHGKVIGAMTIQSALPSAFTDADITALQTMADQVANAIETARLLDERVTLISELETKNAELERYTYTVSHDLKSPLVTIRGYVGYLKESALKGDMKRFEVDMNRVIKATETMQVLLNDLLELSRVGRVINSLANVPFGDMVKDVLNLIVEPQNGQMAWFTVEEKLPIVRCDRTRVLEVLQNLISNSIKFIGSQTAPSIRIGQNGFDSKTGFPIFYVADNGIGIDPKYHETVFGLFNRLDQKEEGTGIGLTLVKRIIEVHGGRIWVESDGQGKGTTFYFTLPLASPSND
ncbi:MAG: ATP-binding protein [Anaerolineales bacterium]